MPEISGKIAFKAQNETVANSLHQIREDSPASIVENLAETAGLCTDQTDLFPEDSSLASESVAHFGQLTVVKPLGDEWIKILEVLQHAKGLEFWAQIQHEHGLEYFIALTETQSFSKTVDLEEGELEDDEIHQIEQAWLATLPTDIHPLFDEDFNVD